MRQRSIVSRVRPSGVEKGRNWSVAGASRLCHKPPRIDQPRPYLGVRSRGEMAERL